MDYLEYMRKRSEGSILEQSRDREAMRWAVAEIEKLREQISSACADAEDVGYYGDQLDSAIVCFRGRIAAQKAEVERLRAALANCESIANDVAEDYREALATTREQKP